MSDRGAGVFIPPPLLFVVGFAVALVVDRWLPLRLSGGGVRASVGWGIVALGVLLSGAGLYEFFRAKTTIIPHHPASRLVTTGAYRFSRNPMYGGLTLVYFGIAMVMGTLWPVVVLPVVLWTLYRMVVRREEAYLSQKFGEAYESYRQRVRRWL